MILADIVIMDGSFVGGHDEYKKHLEKKAERRHAFVKWSSCAAGAVLLAAFGIVLGVVSGDSPALYIPCGIALGAMGFWDVRWIWRKVEQSEPKEPVDEREELYKQHHRITYL